MKGVDAALLRLYGPVLWRSLRVANPTVRAQVTDKKYIKKQNAGGRGPFLLKPDRRGHSLGQGRIKKCWECVQQAQATYRSCSFEAISWSNRDRLYGIFFFFALFSYAHDLPGRDGLNV